MRKEGPESSSARYASPQRTHVEGSPLRARKQSFDSSTSSVLKAGTMTRGTPQYASNTSSTHRTTHDTASAHDTTRHDTTQHDTHITHLHLANP